MAAVINGHCDWCGKSIPCGGVFGKGGVYCSNKCKHAAEESMRQSDKRNRNNDDDKSENLGCLGRIWRIIKIIIGVIVGILILCYILS